MAKHISGVDFRTYRGISNLQIDNLGDVNILLGDNNCGKTSFLEAVQILSRPLDFDAIVMVARQRDRFRIMMPRFTQSQYGSFLNIFDKNGSQMKIDLSASVYNNKIMTQLVGELSKELISDEEMRLLRPVAKMDGAVDEEIETFRGTLCGNDMNENRSLGGLPVTINRFSRVSKKYGYEEVYPVKFLSTVDHILVDNFRYIVKNRELTREVVELLQKAFDSEIVDLRIIEEDAGRTSQMIEHRALGYMPLSTFGDGIKKIIAIAGAAAAMKDGVLLIDEFETAIHPKAMPKVFGFLREVCKERHLQLFVTTHSEEAVVKMLECNDSNGNQDDRVITLYKNADQTVARSLDSKKALEALELGLELR